MGIKQKRSRDKKLTSKAQANRKHNASGKSAKSLAPTKVTAPDRDLPVLFLMLVIIAIPVLGPTPQLLVPPAIIRLSFLLPVVPLLLLYISYKKSAITISLQPVMLTLWGIVVLGVLSSLWAANTYGAITGSLKWFYVLLMSTAVYTLARDSDTQHKIFVACAVAGGYMAFIGVTQYLFGHEIYGAPRERYPWPAATSGHKNMASQFVVMTLPFALYLSLNAKRTISYILVNPLIAMMLGYIIYGRARQAFVAVIAQLLILFVALCFRRSRHMLAPCSRTRDYFISIITSLVLLIGLILAPPFDKPFSLEKTAVSEFASRGEVFTKKEATLQEMSNGRIATWTKTTSMIYDNPEGVGLNNFIVHYDKYNAESGDYYMPLGRAIWANAHNDYLQLLAELGLPVLLLAGLMIIGLWKAYHLIWTKGDEASQLRSLFIGLGLTGLFATMMFSFPLTRTAAPIFLGIYVGLLAAIVPLSLSSKTEKRWVLRPAVFAIILLISVVNIYISYREVSGHHYGATAKALNDRIFQPGDNNPRPGREIMLLLGQIVDEAIRLQPYAPILLRDNIAAYTNLSVFIGDPKLADIYRNKALNAALRHLNKWPNDSKIHMIVATKLQVPNEMAMEHIGKAIALDPGNLQLYDNLRDIATPTKQFDKALTYFEYYIPRFYHEVMNRNYAYFGIQAKQQARVINTLRSIDLTRQYAPGSAQYAAEKRNIEQLITDLQQGL